MSVREANITDSDYEGVLYRFFDVAGVFLYAIEKMGKKGLINQKFKFPTDQSGFKKKRIL